MVVRGLRGLLVAVVEGVVFRRQKSGYAALQK